MTRLLRRPAAIAILALLLARLDHAALADGGALVARGRLLDGSPAAVFIAPVPPRVGLVQVEAVAEAWRRVPPTIRLARAGVVREATASPSEIDPLAAVADLEVPEPGEWHLVVESAAGRLEATVPIAGVPPAWQARLPWMLAWVPVAAILLLRGRLVAARSPPESA